MNAMDATDKRACIKGCYLELFRLLLGGAGVGFRLETRVLNQFAGLKRLKKETYISISKDM